MRPLHSAALGVVLFASACAPTQAPVADVRADATADAYGVARAPAPSLEPARDEMPRRAWMIEVAEGVRIHAEAVGRGRDTLVILHGGPGLDAEYLIPDLGPLHERFTVVYYDQRGGGRSTLAPAGDAAAAWLHIDRHADDLDAVRRFFRLSPMTLVGNSWGAMLAAQYTVRYGNTIKHLILHAPGWAAAEFMAPSSSRMAAMLPAEAAARSDVAWREWRQGGGADVVATCRAFMDAISPAYFASAAGLARYQGRDCVAPEAALRDYPRASSLIRASLGRFDFRPAARAFTAPVLVVAGEQDWIVPASARAWADAFPSARLVSIPNAGHIVHVDQPEAFTNAIVAFISETR